MAESEDGFEDGRIGHIPEKSPRDTSGAGSYCEHTMADSKDLRVGGVVYCHTVSLRHKRDVESRSVTIQAHESRK